MIYRHPKDVILPALKRIYGVSESEAKQAYEPYEDANMRGTITSQAMIKGISARLGSALPVSVVEELWVKYYGEQVKADERVLTLVDDLRSHYKTYIFSNTTDLSDRYNRQIGIYSHFDGLFFSFQMGAMKPETEIYTRVLRDLKRDGNECVFIDDREANLVPARKAGIHTILFDILFEDVRVLKKRLEHLGVR